jgi:UDP-N-acetylmuramoylalanine--D-glutamate ligase
MDKVAKIAILGFGVEGQAMVNYLINSGYNNITICDQKESLPLLLPAGCKFKLGKTYLNDLGQFDYIFRSPGVSCLHPILLKNKSKISSQTAYFLKHCPALAVGITGTKGKGTTSTLIHQILKTAQKDSFLGGNIGEPAINFLKFLKSNSIIVLELSSFQLQDLTQSPQISVVLNITSDHLDYHYDRQEYVTAKHPLVAHQQPTDYLIVNEDYDIPRHFLTLSPARKYTVSTKHEVASGAYILNNKIFVKVDGQEEFLLGTNEVGLLGPHNLENILPAIITTRLLNIDLNIIRQVITEFTGLPHRLEFVAEINQVKYYNDSFSTGPETAIAAINSFPEGTVNILLGGSEKYSDYTELGKKIVNSLTIPICYGQTGSRIAEAIIAASPSYPVRQVLTMEEAFTIAKNLAKSGDNILLSPACASFDLFPNYKARGERFREVVYATSEELLS